jgi:hypothetical protein
MASSEAPQGLNISSKTTYKVINLPLVRHKVGTVKNTVYCIKPKAKYP